MKRRSALLLIATASAGVSAAVWYHQQQGAAREEAILVANYDAGIVIGNAPIKVGWELRNTDGCSWHVVSSQQHCGCAQIYLSRDVIPSGSVLLVNSTIDLPGGVTPEGPEKLFEERVVLPFTIRAKGKTYRVVGIVRGKKICPLKLGPSFLVVQFRQPFGFKRYCWRFHPQGDSRMLDVRCTLPSTYTSLQRRKDSVCLTLRPPKEEESFEGDLIVYHRRTRAELLRIPIVVRTRKGRSM